MSPKWYAPILLEKIWYGIENSKTIENKKKKDPIWKVKILHGGGT